MIHVKVIIHDDVTGFNKEASAECHDATMLKVVTDECAQRLRHLHYLKLHGAEVYEQALFEGKII